MSTKTTIKYFETDEICFHLYRCFVKGYNFDIRVKDMKQCITVPLTKKSAEIISQQMEE